MLDHIAQDGPAQPVLLSGAPVDVQDEVGVWKDHEFVVKPQASELQAAHPDSHAYGPTR